MNTTRETTPGLAKSDWSESPSLIPEQHSGERFYPTGAIAFFVGLVLLCLLIWFGIYFLMLARI